MQERAEEDGPNGSMPPLRPRRGVFRRVFRGVGWLASGPIDWAGTRGIGRGAAAIRGLAVAARSRPQPDPRFRTDEGQFDLEATAFLHGLTVPQLQARLAARRRHTARVAYATTALAVLFLLFWVRAALATPWTASRLALAVYFLPFCLLFFLIAFYHALLNFQIRTGRLASWREYLTTSEPFWPR